MPDLKQKLQNFRTTMLAKQDALTAGDNISIDENDVISSESDVKSVNGKTDIVNLNASDVGADPTGTANSSVSSHNSSNSAHQNLFNAKANSNQGSSNAGKYWKAGQNGDLTFYDLDSDIEDLEDAINEVDGKTFDVVFSYSNGNYTSNKTFQEILNAASSGKKVFAVSESATTKYLYRLNQTGSSSLNSPHEFFKLHSHNNSYEIQGFHMFSNGTIDPISKSLSSMGSYISDVSEDFAVDANGKLTLQKADAAEEDNTKPITSAAVYTEIGNIEVLLAAL